MSVKLRRCRNRTRADGGFTLIELLIAITLGGVIAGVTVAALVTSFSVASATTGQVKDSIDAGLISAYLYRDAQSAGAVDPASALLDPTLGVSTSDRGSGCTTPLSTGTPQAIVDHRAADLVVRFSWIDRATLNAPSRVVVTWALTPINSPSTTGRQLTRRICQPDATVPVDTLVVLGRTVTSASASCVPAPSDDPIPPPDPCAGRPVSVKLSITGTGAGAPFAYDLTASLRGQTQRAPNADNSTPIAFIALGAPTGTTPPCPTVTLNSTGAVTVGDALISSTCDTTAIRGYPQPFQQLAGTATSFQPSIVDPLRLTTAPSAVCQATGGTNPSAGPGYGPGTYQLAVNIGTAVTFQPGNYVFCAGLNINSGARVTPPDANAVVGTGDGVMLYVAKGGLTVDANASVDLTASTTNAYPNLLIWVATTLPQPQVVTIAGGSQANSFRGLVYAPTSTVTLTSSVGANIGGLVSANLVVAPGVGPVRIGHVPSQAIDADIPPFEVGVHTGVNFLYTSGGLTPSTWSATGLPSWLTIGRTSGLLEGTPPQAGSFTFDVTGLDPTNAATSMHVTLVVEPALTLAAALHTGEVGVVYESVGIGATAGLQPYVWTVTGLPDGLGVDADTGLVSGTPLVAGTFPVTISVNDAIGGVASAALTLLIEPPAAVIVPAALDVGEVGVIYSSTALVGGGGMQPYAWSATGLPAGVTVDSTSGFVSGVPSEFGTFDVIVTMTDVLGGTDSAAVTLVVTPAPLVTAPAALDDGQVGAAYESTAITGSGGTTPYAWTATGLPAGLTIDPSTAVISGKPTALGDSTVTVTVTDAVGGQDAATLTLTIAPPPQQLGVASPSALPAGQVGISYSTTIIGTGGFPPYTWSASALPPGLAIDPVTGVVSGTPTTAGSSTATVTVTDAEGSSASRSWTVTIKPVPSVSGPAALPAGDVGFAYKSTTITGTGGTTAYVWSAAGSPGGLVISSTTGVFSGTPTASGNFTVTVTLRDAVGGVALRTYPVTINPAQVVTGPAALPPGQVAQPYTSTTFTSTGGTDPFVWSATGLPAGVTMAAATGAISGTPTAAGAYTVVAKVTDAAGSTATRSLPLTIKAVPSVSLPATLPSGQTNIPYPNTTVTGAGGTTPYTWSATALPLGLVIDATTGVVSGTPTTAGTVTATVKVTDAVGATGTKVYTMVTKAVPTVTTTSLPGGQVNIAYPAATVKGTGGTTPYTWSATGLPPGLVIASTTGVVSGTPTMAGSFTPVMTVTDTFAASSSRTLPAMVIKAPPTITGPAALPPGDVGAVFKSTTMTGTGGSTAYTWTATGLPPGVVLSSTTGVFSGTPTTVGTYSVTVQLKDKALATATRAYTITINTPQTITAPDALPSGQISQPYSATYTSTGGSSPFVWTATGLPTGVTMGSTTGTLSGTPTTAGTYTVVAKVTDAAASAVTKTMTLVVKALPSITGPATMPGGQVNIAYANTTIVGAGGTTPYVWSATAIPPGLTIDPSSGVVSGTPTTAGTYTVTIKLTDAVGATISRSWTSTTAVVIKAAPSVTLAALPGGQVNIAYASTTVTGTGGTTPYVWSATGLPDGLAITSAGVVSGTPTAAGSFAPVVTLTDAAGGVGTKTFPVTIKAVPTISGPASLPAADAGFTYPATTVAATGGTTPYGWTTTGLPAGLVMSATTGAITGTVTTAGSYSVTVTLKDALNATATRIYPLTINPGLAGLGPATLPAGQINVAFPATQATVTGGTTPFVWSATTLPTGLTIDPATGVISGTPTTSGSFTSTVKVNDAVGASVSKTYTVVIRVAPSVTSTATPAAGQVNIAYTTTATGTGGLTPYVWSASTALPNGLTIASATGIVSGTPTVAGTFVSTVVLTDAVGATASKDLTFTIKTPPSITGPASLPSGDVGLAYVSTTVTGTGGATAYAWTATGLPAGVTISTTGVLTGTPTTASTYSVTVTLKDALNATATRVFPVTINAAPVVTTPATLPGGQVGVAYAATTVASTGGTAPYVWSMTGQPAGLTIGPSTAIVSGTPTASGTVAITVKVTDSLGASATKVYTVVFNVPVSVSAPATIPDGQINIAYANTTVLGAGGTTPYTWSATGLPAGMSIAASTGVISGTPTASGAFSVTVTVTDAAGGVATRVYTPTIRAAPSVSGPAVLPGGTVGFAYPATTMVGAGGLAPYSWTGTGLPTGLAISTAGVITGTPTAAGTSSTVVVTVKDNLNATAPRTYSIVVNPVPSVSGPTALAVGEVGVAYTSTATATGGTAPFAWSATGLPAGLSIVASTGVISGTPTAAGDAAVSVSVTDAVGAAASRSWTLSVKVAPSVSGPAALSDGQIGLAYPSTTVVGTGGVTPYSWSAVGLPAGLTINASSGVVSGAPTASGSFSATITATDAVGGTARQVYPMAIAPVAGSCPTTIGGWKGEYYASATLPASGTASALCRDDPNIDFDWGTGIPAPGLPADNFSARWIRTQTFLAGTYTFALGNDDGARLYIDGTLVLDRWVDQAYPSPVPTVARTLSAGSHTIVVEYYERTGNARVSLSWS